MMIIGVAAGRRAMRGHQGVPPRMPRVPLWRLLLGELAWAVGQLVREPRVLAALVVGGLVALAVLDAAAPGPVLPWPGRVVLGLLAGLALARGTWSWIRRPRRDAGDVADSMPAVAAAEIVALLIAVVLVAWLVAWLVTLLDRT